MPNIAQYFNPRAPQGARPPTSVRKCGQRYFNPRAPQGARRYDPYVMIYNKHFNPRAPQGARRVRAGTTGASILFQSTRSAGSATILLYQGRRYAGFQSTRSAGSATHYPRDENRNADISIHALRRERDAGRATCRSTISNFNPRAPQGARLTTNPLLFDLAIFQSTRSAGSATLRDCVFFMTHEISIHALRRERDQAADTGRRS